MIREGQRQRLREVDLKERSIRERDLLERGRESSFREGARLSWRTGGDNHEVLRVSSLSLSHSQRSPTGG